MRILGTEVQHKNCVEYFMGLGLLAVDCHFKLCKSQSFDFINRLKELNDALLKLKRTTMVS